MTCQGLDRQGQGQGQGLTSLRSCTKTAAADWKRALRKTWSWLYIRSVEEDFLRTVNRGFYSAWRKEAVRNEWRQILKEAKKNNKKKRHNR